MPVYPTRRRLENDACKNCQLLVGMDERRHRLPTDIGARFTETAHLPLAIVPVQSQAVGSGGANQCVIVAAENVKMGDIFLIQ